MYRGKHPKPYYNAHFHHKKGEWRYLWPKAPGNYSQSDYYSNRWSDSSEYLVGENGIPSIGDEQFRTVVVSHPLIRNYGPNLPDFRERIRQGINATTSAANRKGHLRSFGEYNWFFKTKFPGVPNTFRSTQWHGSFVLNPIPTAVLPVAGGKLDQQALSAFVRKARKAQTSLQFGEFMKDAHKSVGSFFKVRDIFLRALHAETRALLRIREQLLGPEFWTSAKKGRVRDALKHMSSNWLEWLYGINPTISDLESIAFGLWRAYSRSRNGVDAKYVRGWAREFSSTSYQNWIGASSIFAHPNNRVQEDVATMTEQYIAYYGSVRLLRDESGVFNTVTELGLNLSNFLPTLWECIPYSFVVDYFTNLGQIVDALSFPRSDVLWVSRTARAQAHTVVNYSPYISILGAEQIQANQFYASPSIYDSSASVREIYNGSLVPSFRWHLPYRNTDWTGMLALIGQLLGRR